MDLATIFLAMSVANSLPAKLLESICYVESNHNISAIHRNDGNGDSLGVCQIKLSTAKHLGFKGTAKELMKPEVNIKYAAEYLKYQLNRYDGNFAQAITAYNKGHCKSHGGSSYLAAVFNKYVQY